MTALLGPLRTAPWAAKLAIALVALGLLGAGATLLSLAPARARTAALEGRLTALQSEIAGARRAAADLARSRAERAEMERRLETVRHRLPAEREIPSLYRSTYDAAFSTGLAVSLFQPRDPRLLDYYAEIPISITAEGTYHQLAQFLERLSGLPRVVTVSALQVSRGERPGASLRAEMTLATYVYRPPAPAAPRAAPAATTAADMGRPPAPERYSPRGRRDPFQGTAPVSAGASSGADRRSAAASATLTGIVRGPQGPLALVEMPDGVGHVLRPGDGFEAARLLRIDRDAAVFEIRSGSGSVGEQIILSLGQAR
jgi:type IV pilus assembly protein PilO